MRPAYAIVPVAFEFFDLRIISKPEAKDNILTVKKKYGKAMV